jgi:hypothetical protein
MYCIVLYCNVLHCIALHCIVLCCVEEDNCALRDTIQLLSCWAAAADLWPIPLAVASRVA